MHNELRYQAKIHTIFVKLSKEKKKKSASSPPFFFDVKTIKTCFDNKEIETKPCMCGKIKPVLKERGSELPR